MRRFRSALLVSIALFAAATLGACGGPRSGMSEQTNAAPVSSCQPTDAQHSDAGTCAMLYVTDQGVDMKDKHLSLEGQPGLPPPLDRCDGPPRAGCANIDASGR